MKQTENIISEVKLIYRTKVKASQRPQVKTSKDAFELFMEHWDLDSIEHVEEFKLMLLTRSNKVLGIASISKGGINGTVTDVRIILQYAIKSNASGIIICHNHPSGNLQPSESDHGNNQEDKGFWFIDGCSITGSPDYYCRRQLLQFC